ncbi:hypothetical protein V6N12_002925 [Hibiscus sabdariffa]|uniref:Uncharacterized protein n=1 Tax=Hibiscus sabdariffa TaxID=183260 RepID=A0ABR2EC73_9ROSI
MGTSVMNEDSGGLKNQLGTCQPKIRNHLMENDTVQPNQNIARQASTSHGPTVGASPNNTADMKTQANPVE